MWRPGQGKPSPILISSVYFGAAAGLVKLRNYSTFRSLNAILLKSSTLINRGPVRRLRHSGCQPLKGARVVEDRGAMWTALQLSSIRVVGSMGFHIPRSFRQNSCLFREERLFPSWGGNQFVVAEMCWLPQMFPFRNLVRQRHCSRGAEFFPVVYIGHFSLEWSLKKTKNSDT